MTIDRVRYNARPTLISAVGTRHLVDPYRSQCGRVQFDEGRFVPPSEWVGAHRLCEVCCIVEYRRAIPKAHNAP